MSSVDRETSRERERDRDSLVLKHQHSVSDVAGRHIPMWDSSDPDRAPPPLPLNPTASSPITTRAGTSAHIAETARLLQDRARESLPSSYTTNPMQDRSPERSPERSLVKGAQHRRLQSLQTPSVKDLRSYLDGAKSPERPTSRSRTPTSESTSFTGSPEKRESRASTPTPTPGPKRPPVRPLLGENTPPSSTMLALQTIAARELPETAPLSNITNINPTGSMKSQPHSSGDMGNLSTQMVALTNIATSLQREMQALSRRSKDNATDLIALKAATNSRDEDIRKSLRELVFKVNDNPAKTFGIPFLDGKDGRTTPKARKSLSLPRFPSPYDMSDDGGCTSPMPFEREAGIAMLEKIIRDMVTKEGQDNLLTQLSTLMKKAERESGATAQKVTELVEFIKNSSNSQALVKSGSEGNGNGPRQIGDSQFDQTALPGPLTVNKAESSKPYSSPRAADFVTNDIIKMLKKMMESLKISGGTVNEVKSGQWELRRDVMVMGRNLGEKLEDLHRGKDSSRAIEDGASKQDIAAIVEAGIASLKQHLDNVMREKRRQSNSSIVSRATVDNREVYDLVKHALAEHDSDRAQDSNMQLAPVDKDSILRAVREACEEFRPEIELQQFGLERDEILQCLKEGLEDYRKTETASESPAFQRQEIMDAVHEAMQNFRPPPPINEMQELRDDMLQMIRESLDQLHPDARRDTERDTEITRNILIDAVRDTLRNHGPNAPKELSINREDLFDAVRHGLESRGTPFGRYGEQVVNQLDEMLNDMRTEFKNYSTANGRDTEQVLDAMKDGLESLRGEIESYVDRSQDVTGKSEIIDAVRSGLENLRMDVEGYVSGSRTGDVRLEDLLSYIKSEFEHLHERMAEGSASGADEQVLLNALHAGFESLRANVGTRELMGESGEVINETFKEEFEALKGTILAGSSSHRDDILETLREGFSTISMRLDTGGTAGGSDFNDLKEELEHMRTTIASTLLRSAADVDANAIVDAVREVIENAPRSSEHDAITRETIESIHENVNRLHESLAGGLVPSGGHVDKEELLQAVKQGLDDIKGEIGGGARHTELAEALQGEFEKIRQSIANGVVLGSGRANNDEVLDAVRIGLDDLQSHLDKKLENPEHQTQATSEFLDALNEGLEALRGDVSKMVGQSAGTVDMTVSYEILDTLKGGISELRAEIDKIKGNGESKDTNRAGNEIVLADGTEVDFDREVAAPATVTSESLRRDDLSKVEVMLGQIQIKVEAMDANIQNPPPPSPPIPSEAPTGSVTKEDLNALEDMIKDLQATVNVIGTRDDMDGMAKKEDTDAIETLLRNTKAQFDECLPNPDDVIRREHIETIDKIVREGNEKLEFIKELAGQTDVAMVEVLIKDAKSTVEEIKEALDAERNSEEKVEKKHVDTLGHVCMEIKNKLDEMKLPDPDSLPSKSDIEELQDLINDFRESHDTMKDGYETDIQITARAFDDRKKEAEEMIASIDSVKSSLEDVKDELNTKVEEASGGVSLLFDMLKGLETTVAGGVGVTDDVKALADTINTEFEKAHASIQFLKESQQEKAAQQLENAEERKAAIVSDVTAKLDEHFAELMSKYDDAQVQAELQAKTMEEKTSEQTTVMSGTREMAEELRLTIDTLGSAMTSMQETFDETKEKLTDESNFKTLFEKIEESTATVEEATTENKVEGQLTRDILRDEIAKAVGAVNGLHGEVTDYQPRFMTALQEIQALINQHYEHSQKAQESAQESARIASESAKTHVEEIKSSFSNLPALMPAAEPLPAPQPVVVEKYKDDEVQAKLDRLVEMASQPKASEVQLERLDKIHEQVIATAAEVSAFVASQTRLIGEAQESHEKEAQEMQSLLERRKSEKNQVESELEQMRAEKESLSQEIELLKCDREVLLADKNQLSRDVSSIHTALEIRREELRAMQNKADEIHDRILQGLMDQSRALLIARSAKAAPPKASKPAPTPQRVASNMSHSTISSLPPPPSSAAQGLGMALKTRPGLKRNSQLGLPGAHDTQKARRIMSLSQITGNATTGVRTYLGPNMNPQQGNLTGGIKRSHSVKSNWPRKSSWNVENAPKSRVVSVSEVDEDKENASHDEDAKALVLAHPQDDVIIMEEEDTQTGVDQELDDESEAENTSDAGTERRLSQPTVTVASQDTETNVETMSDDCESIDDRSESASESDVTETESRRSSGGTMVTASGESDLSYGTGSYLTGTDIDAETESDRRSSYESTVRSELTTGANLGDDDETEMEEEEETDGSSTSLVSDEEIDGTEVPVEDTPAAEPAVEDNQELKAEEVQEPSQAGSEEASSESQIAETVAETATHVEASEPYPTKEFVVFNTPAPSDSGLGTDLPTADLPMSGSETDYFRRKMEEESSTLSGA